MMDDKHLNTIDKVKVAERQDDGHGKETTSPQREVSAKNRVASLLKESQVETLQSRWQTIQMEFVDKPQATVEKADMLVAEVIERFSELLTQKHNELKQEWSRSEYSTEELRLTLQHYRAFLNHLLSV